LEKHLTAVATDRTL